MIRWLTWPRQRMKTALILNVAITISLFFLKSQKTHRDFPIWWHQEDQRQNWNAIKKLSMQLLCSLQLRLVSVFTLATPSSHTIMQSRSNCHPAELRSSSACAVRDLKFRRSKTEEKGKMSLKRTKNRDFSSLWNKSVDIFSQPSVLASCPASTSSWDRPQRKQRHSKWCGVELWVSLTTRRNSNSSCLPGQQNEPWLFHSTNSFTCHMPSYRKIHEGDRPLFKLGQGAIPAFGRSIDFDHPLCRLRSLAPRVLTESCYVRMKVQNLART